MFFIFGPTGEVLRLGRISGHTVNGGWSSWSSWSQCSRDCSRGIRSRKRTCSNPEPKYGGQTCLGPAQEYQECNITPCPGGTCAQTHAHAVHTNSTGTIKRRYLAITAWARSEVNYFDSSLVHSCTHKYTLLQNKLKLYFSLSNG